MAGGAQLGGHIYVGADKARDHRQGGCRRGRRLDRNTLGRARHRWSKGGVGVSNLLNAASLILNRFANRDNPISGHVDIAGGVLSDRSLIVQGDRATANIVTRTNLAASTPDTTVNISIAEDGSAPYLIATVRGPLSSPSYNVVRGTAKDPPGFVNTLTSGVDQVTQPVRSIIPNIPIPNPIPNCSAGSTGTALFRTPCSAGVVLLDRLLTALKARFEPRPALTEAPKGVDVLADMANRRVIRRYTDKPVEPALLDTLCAVALSAPPRATCSRPIS
jgi:hypothetical protein